MIIYKITNLINGKIYIGQTQKTLEERMKVHKHGKLLVDVAIKENGIENFSYEVVEECQTIDELNEREKFWIEKLNCKYPNGYNIDDGGGGFICNRFNNEINIENKLIDKIIKAGFVKDDVDNKVIDFISILMMSIDLLGDQKLKVCKYILENMDMYNNQLLATIDEIRQNSGVSKQTVVDTLKILEEANIIRRKTGIVFVSPKLINRGSQQKRALYDGQIFSNTFKSRKRKDQRRATTLIKFLLKNQNQRRLKRHNFNSIDKIVSLT